MGWVRKVVPPFEQGAMLASRKADLQNGINDLTREIDELQRRCYALGFDLMVIQDSSHLNRRLLSLTEYWQVSADAG